MQLYADIRHDARVDGLSIRELARKHGVHRRTVRRGTGGCCGGVTASGHTALSTVRHVRHKRRARNFGRLRHVARHSCSAHRWITMRITGPSSPST